MNESTKVLHTTAAGTVKAGETLGGLEKGLLVLPMLGTLVLGVLALFFSQQFAARFGFTGSDTYLYRLSGAVMLGYVPGLLIAILQGEWTPVRLVVIATLVLGLGTLFAVTMAIIAGTATPFVYAVLVAGLATVGIALWLLNNHREVARPAADVARWVVYLLVFLTAAAIGTGVLFLIAPLPVSQFFGFQGTDELVIRLGGAATFGFGVMGILELRSRAWRELRLPSINAMLFNGASFVATILAIFAGDPILLLGVVLVVAFVATVGSFIAIRRQGK